MGYLDCMGNNMIGFPDLFGRVKKKEITSYMIIGAPFFPYWIIYHSPKCFDSANGSLSTASIVMTAQ